MLPDVEILARLQFAGTIMFHYIFPPLSIGLGWILVIMEGRYLQTGDTLYEAMARFWTKVFAVNFAMGVATGIVMEFEFGTNWAAYSRFVGDVFGSALAAEGIFAFFLESGFLAVLVFGWDRVSSRMHFFSTLMVALGATFSAVWIVVANSWQQTPAGYHLVGEGDQQRAEIVDFWAMVFNPSSMHRLNHVFIGALMLGGFFVISISAWYLLKRRHEAFARSTFRIGLFVATVATVASFISGHFQAAKVAETQPAKLAAFEGHFKQTGEATPLYIVGWPDEAAQEVRFGIAIPKMLSFLVHENFHEPVTALDEFPEEDRPPVLIPFMTYHLMIGVAVAALAMCVVAGYLLWRGTLFTHRPFLWACVFFVIAPYLGNQAGWIAAEVGRQPWIVYGMLRTSDGLSEAVTAGQVFGSILMFGFIYSLLFMVWVYVLNDKIQHGPEDPAEHGEGHEGFLSTATALADPGGASMTSVREEED